VAARAGGPLSASLRIYLARLEDPYLDQPADMFAAHAANDEFASHRLVDSPEQADAILFTQCHMFPADWRLRVIRAHPLVREFRHKVLLYNELDVPWCGLPGVYVNMPARHFRPGFQRAWGYFVPAPGDPPGERDLLFSFIGSDTTPIRGPLFDLRHPQAIVERVEGFQFWDPGSERFAERRRHFTEILGRSRFVLCPRGNGVSSVRLYEALAAGAVPVIIADQWSPPPGPDWERCVLRWPEGRVDGVIELLERRAGEWPAMSAAARRAYEDYFAPGVYFHRVAGLCAELLEQRATITFPRSGVIDRRYGELMLASVQGRLRGERAALLSALRRERPAGGS
jgi:hypothetical protein